MIKLSKSQQRKLYKLYKDSLLRSISISDLIESGYYNSDSNKKLYNNVKDCLMVFINYFEDDIKIELTKDIKEL